MGKIKTPEAFEVSDNGLSLVENPLTGKIIATANTPEWATRIKDALNARPPQGQLPTDAERAIKLLQSSINGALDGLELDNTDELIEKSHVISQLKYQMEIIEEWFKKKGGNQP